MTDLTEPTTGSHADDLNAAPPEGAAARPEGDGAAPDGRPAPAVPLRAGREETDTVAAALAFTSGEAGEGAARHDGPASRAADLPIVPDASGRVQVAAFDFDGTTIQGNSPVMLVRYLALRGMLRKSVIFRILLWAGAYKVRLPQNESWVRGLVFSAFKGEPVAKVDAFLARFYHEMIEGRFRPQAVAALREHAEAGHAVVWVSASFEPIILEAMRDHYVHYQCSTRMRVDAEGDYTDQVEGLPVEGAEKMVALRRLCDAEFGAGNWELGWAYGDHHSDRPLLDAARVPYAVTPDRPLARTARREGWQVLDWEID